MGSRAKNREIKWGCAARIKEGRAICDSHHVNEATLERTYLAAIAQMAENADTVIEAVREGALLTMEPENNARLAAVEQAIIEMQESALALHKQKVGHKITEAEYNEAIQECSQQMQQLEAQQAELQTVATRYAEVKVWLDAFETNIRTGEIMSTNDAMVMKTLVERIIVNDTDIEVQFKCGVSVQQEYVK